MVLVFVKVVSSDLTRFLLPIVSVQAPIVLGRPGAIAEGKRSAETPQRSAEPRQVDRPVGGSRGAEKDWSLR